MLGLECNCGNKSQEKGSSNASGLKIRPCLCLRAAAPLTFEVEGSGIWFFRNGKLINWKLTRARVDVAISRCPRKGTTEFKNLVDFAYLFAVLMDRRIRGDAW